MKILKLAVLCLTTLSLGSCVKQAFDSPPDTSQYDPYLTVNCSLEKLSELGYMLPIGQFRTMGDTTVYGIVSADDKSGNIYKKLYIQDSSGGGMTLILDKSYLYGDYPVGRKIYVKLNGLMLANYKGQAEIVSSMDILGNTVGIPASLMTKYIIKASYPNPVTATTVDASELFSNPYKYASTFVKLDNMQFDDLSKNTLYSMPSSSTNRTITNCDKTISLSMYNSSYATFQAAVTPNGNGSIYGIVTLYMGKPQLTLRDTFDIQFIGPRCP